MDDGICVVGAGRWGKNHIRTLHELGCLGGVVETSAPVREDLAGKYPDIPVLPDLHSALAKDFRGYTVATPAETHYAVGRSILEAHRPVLIEKPLALRSWEARELARLARKSGVNLMVGHVLLFHPAIRTIKRLIDEGKIGKLQYLYSNRLNLGTIRTEENILWSFAPHDISIFQHLIGRTPTEVVSRGGAFVQPHLHDSTMTVLTYPDNVIGHIFVSWLHPFKEHRLVVIGSKGMLSFEDTGARKLLFYEKGIDWVHGTPVKRDGPTETVPFDARPALTEELAYFVERLNGDIDVADAESGIEVLEILERAAAGLASDLETASSPEAGRYFIHPSSYVDEGVAIGEGTRIWHFCHVQPNAVIGRGCTLGQNVNVANNVVIGDYVKIQNNVSVYEGVELEDYVFCGPSMVFTNVTAPRSEFPQRGHYAKTLVKRGATIGANATIACGHTIGRYAFVGAGAVVTTDVPDHALVLGVPAVQRGWVCECGNRLALERGAAACSRCALTYRLEEGRLVRNVPS